MPRPIQSQAPAFLNLLGLKNQGALPPDLVEAVQPHVDMLPFYLRGAMQAQDAFYAGLGAPFTGGFLPIVSVPANEWWFVEYVTPVLNLGGGTAVTMEVRQFSAAAAAFSPLTVEVGPQIDLTTVGVSAGVTARAPTLRNFWLPPGGSLGVAALYINIADGVPQQVWTVNLQFRYAPILV